MPIIKSAIKKMRQDRRREKVNRTKRDQVKKVLKEALKDTSAKTLSKAFSSLDRAAKKGLLPKGRVDRKKARLAKALSEAKAATPIKKTSEKKTSRKKASK